MAIVFLEYHWHAVIIMKMVLYKLCGIFKTNMGPDCTLYHNIEDNKVDKARNEILIWLTKN